jgi:hypothetical protein
MTKQSLGSRMNFASNKYLYSNIGRLCGRPMSTFPHAVTGRPTGLLTETPSRGYPPNSHNPTKYPPSLSFRVHFLCTRNPNYALV